MTANEVWTFDVTQIGTNGSEIDANKGNRPVSGDFTADNSDRTFDDLDDSELDRLLELLERKFL